MSIITYNKNDLKTYDFTYSIISKCLINNYPITTTKLHFNSILRIVSHNPSGPITLKTKKQKLYSIIDNCINNNINLHIEIQLRDLIIVFKRCKPKILIPKIRSGDPITP